MSGFVAPGQTTQALLDALRERLAALLADMHLPTDVDGEPARAPEIIDGFLPPKRGKAKGKEQGQFPFVIVQPARGEDTAQNAASAAVRLVIGVCHVCPDDAAADSGYRDWMAIKERIRTDLLSNPVVGGRFRLEYPMRWDVLDEQPAPQFLGVVELNFSQAGIVDNSWMEGMP